MKRSSLWLLIGPVLMAGAFTWNLERVKPGERIKVSDLFMDRKAGNGFGIFAIRWRPDPNKNFNEVACILCHDTPGPGGAGKGALREVRFVPDEKEVSGMRNFRRQHRNVDGHVEKFPYPSNAEFRKSPPLYGLGFIDAIPAEELAKRCDPTDADHDGISGRQVMIDGKPGRFGWKGNVPSLQKFVESAFLTELGLGPFDADQNNDAVIDGNQIDVTFWYVRLLAPPMPDEMIAKHEAGRTLFQSVGCANCHTPSMKTGASEVPELANTTIQLYSDLLLHDLSDHPRPVETDKVLPNEYRTAPLWGIGAVGGPYLHNGSAITLTQAIEGHHGEGESSMEKFKALNDADRAELLAFVNCL